MLVFWVAITKQTRPDSKTNLELEESKDEFLRVDNVEKAKDSLLIKN